MSNQEMRFESQVERNFAHYLVKYLRPEALLEAQVDVQTMCGLFRLDFLVTYPSDRRIGLECDGKEYHDQSRDEFRDAVIIGDGGIDCIYRLRGADLSYHVEDLLYIVSMWNAEIFSERSRMILGKLRSPEIRAAEKYIQKTDTNALVRYHTDSSGGDLPHHIWIERQYRDKLDSFVRTWCSDLYEFAQTQGGGKLETVYELYHAARHLRLADSGP